MLSRFLVLLVASLLASPLPSQAAPPASLTPFLAQHCLDCHDGEEKKGGLDLDALDFTPGREAHAKWVRIYDRVLAGEMPPPKKARPDVGEQRAFLATLGQELTRQHTAAKGTLLRRLNRQEYQNTLNDLLGTQAEVMALLPEDGRAHGFDTIGEALALSSIQMQRYMEAAELALNAAMQAGPRPEVKRATYRMDEGRNAENIGKHWLKRPDGAVVFFNNGGFPSTQVPGLRASATGLHRVRVTGYGFQIQEPVPFAVIAGTFNRGGDQEIRGFYELPPDKSATVEFTLALREGDGIKLSAQGLNGPDGRSPIKDGPDNYQGEGLAIASVEMEGPLLDEWPPRGQPRLLGDATVREVPPAQPWMRGKFGYKPVFTADAADPKAAARKLLPGFLTKAFRRPVSAAEVAPYLALFDAELTQSGDFLVAMRTAAIAALCSPEFLYLKEPAGRLDDHALAARLSYFLARTAPDAELLKLAAAKELTPPATLRAQTERLLRGPGLDRFIADFTDGWLNLREIDFTTPDKQLYPEFDELLQDSMLRETRSFLRELIAANLGAASLIASDFGMLNARLARHYGIPGVSGLAMRRVKLPPESRRGGLLTQGSVLKVSANGTNTSPVIRGVWVQERILGFTPSPPPPGTPGVEPDTRGAKTVREILAAHRTMESCQGCHRIIDPPGFALESYDVIGGWRDRFRSLGDGERVSLKVEGRNVRYKLGPPVDAAGELPTGEKFGDFAEFQKHLLAQQDRVARCVTEKLLTFATGREMGFSDRPEIGRLVTASREKKHALRDLLHAVVQSDIFRSK
jgi:hypothetical protein